MSVDTTAPPTNIVHFTKTPTPPTESGQKPAPLSEKGEAFLAIKALCEFLNENPAAVEHFVCGISMAPKPGEGENRAFHVFTSPIAVSEFALTLKLLDRTLFAALED